ncbi:MAG: putative metal-binding motif-containing protein [Myxococcota bacterium]|nr:putative metal-binding motif-containing protein [Myxococcota bacterium]
MPLIWLLAACKSPPTVDSDTGTAPISDICDGLDDDGDGRIDEDAPTQTWHADLDGDGFGDPAAPHLSCAQPSDHVQDDSDCDDTQASVFPGADEICDGIDEDCDALIDESPTDGASWYADLDGDGFGAGEATLSETCEPPPEGYSFSDTDCDDGDASIHPDATEICDGVDNDCDAGTPESGLATFQPQDGGPLQDWSGTMARSAPVQNLVVDEPGTLALCPGIWFTTFRVRADFTLQGVGEGVQLHGNNDSPLLVLRQDGLSVVAADVELRNGSAVGVVAAEYSAGGAVECSGESGLSLERVEIRDSTADVGGAIWVAGGCALSASAVLLHDNLAGHYGGALAVTEGSALVQDASQIESNQAPYGGAGAVLGADSSLELLDSQLYDNFADEKGGALIVEQGQVVCTGDPSLAAGLWDNSASDGGGVWLDQGATLESRSCDWGTLGSDNNPQDLEILSDSVDRRWGDDVTFSCDDSGCQ